MICLSAFCFWFSDYVMVGYMDCSVLHTIPHPTNCAAEVVMLSKELLRYCGLGLLFIAFFLPLFIAWRKEKFSKNGMESIKFPNQDCLANV